MAIKTKLLNPKYLDSSLLLEIIGEKCYILFDCGATFNIPQRQILKINHIFISHTHIDHFIGFDNILRNCIGKIKTINIYGPKNIIKNVENKLHGYTWNLDVPNNLIYNVFEINKNKLKHSVFTSDNKFIQEKKPDVPISDNIILKTNLFEVRFIKLNHIIDSIGYSFEEPDKIRIKKEILVKLNLTEGPWIREFINHIKNHETPVKKYFNLDFQYLKNNLIHIEHGNKIVFITDTILNDALKPKILKFIHGCSILYCEASFLQKDIALAKKSYHLTAAQAGQIARDGKVKSLEIFHFSKRYLPNRLNLLEEEAKKHFLNK